MLAMLIGVATEGAQAITRSKLASYASALQGKKQAELKTAVYNLCQPSKVLSYGSGSGATWSGFVKTDRIGSTLECRNRYSTDRYYFSSTTQTSAISGMNIEHSFPKSWWGGDKNNAYKDLYNLYPSESSANSSKSNYVMDKVSNASVLDDYEKVGTGANASSYASSASKYAVEPHDNWKGDFCRSYFYMVTVYQNFTWTSAGLSCLENDTWPTLQSWAQKLYLSWAHTDIVDSIEVNRNNNVYSIQGNRNLFIDYPYLADYIWGDSTDVAFNPYTSISTASDDDRYTGTASGGDDSGDDTPTTTYKYVKTTTIESGKHYLIVANNSGTLEAASPLSSNYGYLQKYDVTATNDVITLTSRNYEFLFTTSGTGYTIQQNDGKYLYQTGSYNSFNVSSTEPSSGSVWTVAAQSDGTFKITNQSVSKYIQYSTSHSSYGSYSSSTGIMPNLYVLESESGSETKMPELSVSPTSLSFSAEAGSTATQTFTVTGTDLTGNVTATLTDANSVYSLSSTTVTVAEATAGKTITVTFAPSEAGTFSGTVTLSSTGAQSVTVSLNGTATASSSDDGTTYVKVTSNDQLQSGKKYLIVYEAGSVAMAAKNSSGNYRDGADVTISNNTITTETNTSGKPYELTLGGESGAWTLYDATNDTYLGLTSDDNSLYNVTEGTDGYTWTIDVTATNPIQNNEYTSRYILYNTGNPRFACYKTTSRQKAVALYVKQTNTVVTTPTLTVSPTSLSFTAEAGSTATATFTVTGTDLTGNVTLALDDLNRVYYISETTVSTSDAAAGKVITVTFAPTETGTFTGTITVSADGAESKTVSLSGTATEKTSKVRYKSSSTDSWHYLLPDDNGAYNITDGDYYAFDVTEDVANATVNYTRSLTKDVWAAWTFPIDITVTSDLLSKYQFGYLEGVSNEGNDITKEDLQGVTIGVKMLTAGKTIKANLPYVILPQTTGSNTFTATGTLKKTEPQSTQIVGNAYKYVSEGIYTYKNYADDLWYALTTSGQLQKAGSGAYLMPFRFFLTVTDSENNPYLNAPETIKLVISGETTGISSIKTDSLNGQKVYDLQGRRVSKPTQKGIYIVNGRKVVVSK